MKAWVSLWSANPLELGAAVDAVAAEADGFHLDVFDGHNVPELLFGPDAVAALRRRTPLPLEVHLNVNDPDYWAGRFIDVGADIVTFQSRATSDVRSTIDAIRDQGARPCLGLEVDEPTSVAVALFDSVDRVLVMGTPLGVRGVALDPATPGRVSELVDWRRRSGRGSADLQLVVDGGIRASTVDALADAGADGVVPGSLVFGDVDPLAAIRRLHALGCGGLAAG
jgi:ribulose-phosphate 3-epimerase